MKAAVVERRDQPIRIGEFPTPEPGECEILVRVTVAGVNPIDWKTLERGERAMPFVPGQDFAGIVSAVGPGVTKYRVAQRVFGIARERGAYAQFTVVPQDDATQPIAKLPDDVGDADAAALPTAGLTALAALDWLGVERGTALLILGATGGVGGYAVQMARDRGAHVTGTARAASEAYARKLGVDAFVAYDRDDVAAAIKRAHPHGIEAILDLVDGADAIERTLKALAPGGRIVSTIGALDEASLGRRGILGKNLVLAQSRESSHAGLRSLIEMVEQGRLHAEIAAEEPLEEAQRALERSRQGTVNGKMLLTVG